MNEAPVQSDEREMRVNLAIYDYHEAVDRGDPVDPREWVERFPDLREELESYFKDLGLLTRLIASTPPADPDATRSLASARLARGGPDAPDSRPGDMLGDYVLLEKLGEGGQGVVWKASPKHSPEIVVALKTLRGRALNDPESIRRLRDDANAIARMRHEQIVKISYFGEDRGRWFFVLELIEGGTVNDRLAAYQADPRSAAEVIMKIARAVHHAHTRNPGVLHLDLKPGNILLTSEGEPKVTDFGLSARSTLIDPRPETESSDAPPEPRNVTETLARAGIVGTVPYMSPEMASGRWSEISTASDIYGLGAVLYAMLTGRAPFRGETVSETLDLVRAGGPVAPRELNRHIDTELAAICMKCLRQVPEERYGSADALANDLRRYLEHRPTHAGGRTSVRRELLFWARRHPWRPIAGLVLAFALWGVGLAARVADLRTENARDASRLASQVDRELRLIRRAARIMASDQRLEKAFTDNTAPEHAARRRQAIEDFLDTAVEKENLFGIAGENPLVNVFVLDPGGVLLADTLDRSSSVGKNFRVRDYFRSIVDNQWPDDHVHVATSFLSIKDNRQKIGVSTRVRAKGGGFLGVLVANLTIGTRLIDVDIRQEPHAAAVLCPLDRSNPDEGIEDTDRPRPYVSVLDQRYTPDWKGAPYPAIVAGLDVFQEQPALEHVSAGIQAGQVVDCHRVGSSQLVAVTRRACPWPLSWLRFFR